MSVITKYTPGLVSVIIPTYNHGKYLLEALESIWSQKYPLVEVIIVDDGSIDNTKEIVAAMPGLKYVYQTNQGLSTARNTGVKNSNGEYFLFLDADDWLLPGSIAINVACLQVNKTLAFVSGAHEKVFVDEGKSTDEFWVVTDLHYQQLLEGNYIGMHATVLYSRWIFDEFSYDINLRACEDYDLYLKITRKYPVLHHTVKIAAYRIHGSNMSANIPMMLRTVLMVLDRQKEALQTAAEKAAFANGHKVWKDYYCFLLYELALKNHSLFTKEALLTLLKYHPKILIHHIFKRQAVIKTFIKNNTPAFGKRWLNTLGLYNSYCPAVGSIVPADFDRLSPFSTEFGYDRGGPVDRYYIENFLQKQSGNIKGRTLEIGDNEYSLMYGGSRLTQSDILHIDATNAKATFIGDLSDAPQLPDNGFDCIVLTQTLHLIYNFKGALDTCYRILKPGGVLLITSPGITPMDHGEWKSTWYWSFTNFALKRMVADAFPGGDIEVETFGNVYVATAFLYGMGKTEVPKEKMDYHDPHFQVIITVKAIKK